MLHNEAEIVLRIMLTDSSHIEQYILRIVASQKKRLCEETPYAIGRKSISSHVRLKSCTFSTRGSSDERSDRSRSWSRSGDESQPRDQELEVPTAYELINPEARDLMRSLTASPSEAVNRQAVCCE